MMHRMIRVEALAMEASVERRQAAPADRELSTLQGEVRRTSSGQAFGLVSAPHPKPGDAIRVSLHRRVGVGVHRVELRVRPHLRRGDARRSCGGASHSYAGSITK
jgi:hypothetical protein